MKFNSFKNKWPAEDQVVLVRFQRPTIGGPMDTWYEILDESELDEKADRFAVGWMPVEDLDDISCDIVWEDTFRYEKEIYEVGICQFKADEKELYKNIVLRS